jgi:chemotaxis protein MotB
VVRYFTNNGLAKQRMSAVGFSDTHPLIDPKDPRSITMNRRVDVVVLTQLPADQAALLPAAAGDDTKLHTGETSKETTATAETGQTEKTTGGSTTTSDSTTTTHD